MAYKHGVPAQSPPGYSYLDTEPTFDRAVDLDLSRPTAVTTLSDLRYSAEFRAQYGSDLALTAPFRLLSASGVAKLRGVVDQLSTQVWRGAGVGQKPAAVGRMLRGNVYRSRFIRDLITDEALADFLSDLGDIRIAPSAYVHEVAHLNFPPEDMSAPAVAWHHDTNAFVLVVMVHDPADVDGGDFQYYAGPRHEGRALLANAGEIPEDRCVTPHFPGAGYAVLMQGSALLHRATPLRSPAPRISMATSFDVLDMRYPDQNRFYLVAPDYDENNVNARIEHDCRYAEHSRYLTTRTREKLGSFLDQLSWTDDRMSIIAALEDALTEANTLIEDLKRGDISRDEAKRLRAVKDAQAPR
jgi:hypothetical protein